MKKNWNFGLNLLGFPEDHVEKASYESPVVCGLHGVVVRNRSRLGLVWKRVDSSSSKPHVSAAVVSEEKNHRGV